MKFLKIILILSIILSLFSCNIPQAEGEENSSGSSSNFDDIDSMIEPMTETSSPADAARTVDDVLKEELDIPEEEDPEPEEEEPEGLVKPEILPETADHTALPTTQITWGHGTQYEADNRPTAPIGLQEMYKKYGAYFIGENGTNIYLTFDEGYENGYTAPILDTLLEKEVSAVFFVTLDYVKQAPELVQRMIDEGHIVGNHTCKHPNLTTVEDSRIQEEVIGLHDYMLENFAYEMWLIRPPEGAFSERSLAYTHSLGYLNVFWSYAYADWDPDNQPDTASSLQRLTERLHPGAIYLLHAVSSTNSAILGDFIDAANTSGYTFAPFTLADPSGN